MEEHYATSPARAGASKGGENKGLSLVDARFEGERDLLKLLTTCTGRCKAIWKWPLLMVLVVVRASSLIFLGYNWF